MKILKSIKEYKHVIWDWNGTLLDDQWICLEIINKMLGKRGIELLTKSDYKEVFGFPIKEYYERLGFDFLSEPFEALSEEYISEYDARSLECGLQVEVREILEELRGMGLSQSILSASREETLRQVVKEFGIDHHFIQISGLDNDYAASKIDIGRDWLKTQSFQPHEAVMIGDTEHDFHTAQAMGTDCILIANGHQSIERLEKYEISVLESVSELRKWTNDYQR